MIRSHSATFDFNHKQGAQRVTYRTPEYNVPPWLTNRTGWPSWFPIHLKITQLLEDVEILLYVKFCWSPFNDFREVENASANQRLGGHLAFQIGPKNTNLIGDFEILLPVKFHWILFSDFREVEIISANQRPGSHHAFPIGPKITNLIEDVEVMLRVKFRWIRFSGFRGDVENASANRRPGQPSYFFPICPKKKHILNRGRQDLASWQISLNSV